MCSVKFECSLCMCGYVKTNVYAICVITVPSQKREIVSDPCKTLCFWEAILAITLVWCSEANYQKNLNTYIPTVMFVEQNKSNTSTNGKDKIVVCLAKQ